MLPIAAKALPKTASTAHLAYGCPSPSNVESITPAILSPFAILFVHSSLLSFLLSFFVSLVGVLVPELLPLIMPIRYGEYVTMAQRPSLQYIPEPGSILNPQIARPEIHW